jgi:hypothetical protein
MALAREPMPLPPELAEPDPPIPEDQLEQLWEQAAAMAADASLDPDEAVAAVAHDLAMEDDHHPLRWRVTDTGSAEWAMRHVAEATAELEHLQMQRDAWAEQIDGWFRRAADRVRSRRAFFDQLLQLYAIEQREASNDKIKSVVVPSGRVRTTKAGPKVVVRNPADVLAWAEERGVLDQVAPPKREVKLTPLRELVQPVLVVDQARLLLHDGQLVHWVRQEFDAEAHGYPTDATELRGSHCPNVGDGHYLWRRPDAPTDTEGDGSGYQLEKTDLPALVAKVEVLCAHTEAQDQRAEPVPGCWVDPGGITATVQAERP